MMAPPIKSGPRFDQLIQSDKVRVIDENGENIGVMYTNEAIEQAASVGLNLVEVSPNADPPVCKFLDVGKYRYEAQKKANLARKSQKTQEIKEIKVRPNIDDHDYDVKLKAMHKFIENGDKVKVTLRFRGREWPTSIWVWTCCAACRTTWPKTARWKASPASKAARW